MKNSKQSGRRERALKRLQEQLKKGTKNTKEGVASLTEKDVKRINREIGILETKV